ncbi:hypothetical protein CO670_15110 [Rhizobium sp. J15]|nr:hypothetical protein CO670_15110 [Rhizobium sp. J15]
MPPPPPFPPPLPPPPPLPLPPPLPSLASARFIATTGREPLNFNVAGDAAATRATAAPPLNLRKSRFEILTTQPHSCVLRSY